MTIHTPEAIAIMTEGGHRLGIILEKLLKKVVVGVTPLEIDTYATELIKKAEGTPSFMTVKDYQWATCISVNEGVVHGVPTSIPLKMGDVVGVDVGLLYKGYHTDTSWTKVVTGPGDPIAADVARFLTTGEAALQKAIHQARVENRVGHISQAIQTTVEGAGYTVVKSLVGHGIGKTLHEAPHIPGILTRPIASTPELKAGMALAVEVIYTMGSPDIVYANDDGWSLVSADGSLSGLYEQTIIVSKNGPIVLTQSQK